jgi:hypothetical protein
MQRKISRRTPLPTSHTQAESSMAPVRAALALELFLLAGWALAAACGQADAQAAFAGAADAQPTGDSFGGGTLSAEDQSLINGFADPSATPAVTASTSRPALCAPREHRPSVFLRCLPQNLFDASTPGAARNFGLAPQFNRSTGGGALARLRYTGTATVGYDELPIASSGAVNLGCGFGYVDAPFQAAYAGVRAARRAAHIFSGCAQFRQKNILFRQPCAHRVHNEFSDNRLVQA